MQTRLRRYLKAVTLLLLGAGVAVALACAPAAAPTPAPTAVPTKPAPAPTTPPAPTAVPTKPAPTTAPAPTAVPTKPAPAPTTAPAAAGNVLTAMKAAAAPKIDGDAADADWAKAQALNIRVTGGQNLPGGATEVALKAIYTADSVYFLAQWADPTESVQRAPWQKQADGTWKQLKDGPPGDNNKYYEDKFAMIWNIKDSIKDFNTQGCFALCHAGEPGKPYGNKYTASAGETGDIWHWKSIRTGPVGQIDDQWVDNTRYDAEKAPEAGRKSDAKTAGGYVDNISDDKKTPKFSAPASKPAPPYYIKDAEKVAFDTTKYKANDEVAGILVAPFTGDRGDLTSAYTYKGGKYTLEWGRKLNTGSQTDVQFADLNGKYFFGAAVFDNAQVRHAFQSGVNQMVFAK